MTGECWVVADIGCFECGVGSTLVGVYQTMEEAESAKSTRERNYYSSRGWRDGGEAAVFVWRADAAAASIQGAAINSESAEAFTRLIHARQWAKGDFDA